MPASLVKPLVLSIYEVSGHRVPLPNRMAQCTPDMKAALYALRGDLQAKGGDLVLSDLFRSYDMQFQAHLDYVTHKKTAYSPPPGGSLHESGRAFDIDLKSIKMSLTDFWPVAKARGLVPIIDAPNPATPECWHFECRGSHQRVSDHYKAGKATNFDSGYHAMAASAIVAVGIPHDRFKDCADEAYLQSALIRLGQDVGNIDGAIGTKTLDGLAALGITATAMSDRIAAIDAVLWREYPGEFFDKTADPINPFA
jgi:hypothetical protein